MIMDYEKLHKDTITKLHQMVNSGKITVETACGICADFVPESEDERIRKDMIETIEKEAHDFPSSVIAEKSHTWLAWLEKQGEQKPVEFKPSFRVGDVIKPKDPVLGEPRIIKGIHPKFGYDTDNGILDFEFEDNWELVEQKPIDKVEPKFKVGDILVSEEEDRKHIYKVDAITNYDTYLLLDLEDGYTRNESVYTSDLAMYLWTIQDAKDGDVLVTLDYILIFKEFLKNDGGISYCHYDFGAGNPQFIWLEDKNWYFGKEAIVYPATKEQRELLFQKMKEAGYEWDAEKKELKKIEQKPADKIEPKFHEGDWAVSNLDGKARQISEVHFDEYNSYYVIDGKSVNLEEYDRLHHLWTIQDAKDGDVLSYRDGQWNFIYKGIVTEDTFKYHALLSEKGITLNDAAFSLLSSCITPATKEQRNTLMKAMDDAGYTFDFVKKELKKIEQKSAENKGMDLVEEEMTPFQKKVFCIVDTSIEEEQGLSNICNELLALAKQEIEQKSADKVEPKFKIGDKIQYLKGCGTIMTIEKIENGEYIFGNNLGHTTIESGNKWHLVNLTEQTPTWSKKDEDMLNTIIDASEHHCMLDLNDIDWLKSIKDKIQPKQE
jgi:co-chaperonin GroES (HSP10)